MHVLLCVLLTATFVVSDDSQERRSKLPYIVDAAGNSLPPPSNVPATVGSPVNLLTPDKYEFYAFDKSGELVKRLMTLEEIQAIVAAGEEAEGLVTYPNDNSPTTTYNFSQPSNTKVHNVVTNVQNVLKAQMEAHKNKPSIRPTLDTPDVSDSWSLILPSIFGNTGVDVVPDRSSESFRPPDTDTIEFVNSNEDSQSKENDIEPTKTSNDIPVKIETTTPAVKLTPTTKQPSTTSRKPITKIESTSKPSTTTPKTKLRTTTHKISSPISTSTPKITKSTSKPITSTTVKYSSSPKLPTSITKKTSILTSTSIPSTLSTIKVTPDLDRVSTFIPITTTTYITEKTTNKSIILTNATNGSISSTYPLPKTSTSHPLIKNHTLNEDKLPSQTEDKIEKINFTTVTTQSVSPSTTTSSTEFLTASKDELNNNEKPEDSNENNESNNESIIPMFDVAQSISQIASDLGGNFAPVPTTSDLLDITKANNLSLESKESIEMDIPTESSYENNKEQNDSDFENYVKISTSDPQKNAVYNINTDEINISMENDKVQVLENVLVTTTYTPNTIDPILSNSVDDMLSQVINQNPETQPLEKNDVIEQQNYTTQMDIDTTTGVYESTTILESETTISSTTTELIFTTEEINIDKKTKRTEENLKFTTTEPIISEKTTIKNDVEVNFISDKSNNEENTQNITLNEAETSSQNDSLIEKPDSKLNLPEPTKDSESNLKSPQSFSKKDTTIIEQTPSTVKNMSVSNVLNKNKASEEKPKIDEFKKKIQKLNTDDKDFGVDRNNSWKLIPTVPPPKEFESEKVKQKTEDFITPDVTVDKNIILDFSKENQGLQVTTKDLGEDVLQFTELCNELAFRYWQEIIRDVDNKRSFVLSPYSITSMLAMMFMGAKGATSGEMNEILKLDDMVTFNPHFTLKNVSDSIETSSSSGVAVSAFIRELYSERNKGKILTFYKERAQHFYNGHVEEINFKLISDIIRRRTNLLVKRYTWGKIPEYIKSNSISLHPPLAAFSTNIFETDCTGSSIEGRDGEMYFVVSPNVRQRRLVPVPAVVYKNNFLAGYDPILDARVAALGNMNSIVSTLFLMPGQQSNVASTDDLEALEKRLLDSNPTVPTWNRLLRTLLPRPGLELQIPRFSHKSMLNVSSTLKKMGLKELFDAEHANLGGLNGPSKDLYLSDMMQLTTFVTCGEGFIGEQHHIEEYPEILSAKRRSSRWATMWDEPRDYQRAFHDPHDLGDAMLLPLHLRPRQARLPARNSQPRLKFDRPFLFFVRHNPTGMILYVGRYNPRLLP